MQFELLETMRVEPDGSIPLLERHLARVSGTAQNLGFACNLDQIRHVIASSNLTIPGVLRLLIAEDGTPTVQYRPLPPPGQLRRVARARVTVNSADATLRHKTTARSIYDQAKAGLPGDTDALLYNQRGEATETTIANIAVLRNGLWITPPVSSGLLPGVMRAKLLEDAGITEGIVPIDTLVPGEVLRCFNAVRGVFDLTFVGILTA